MTDPLKQATLALLLAACGVFVAPARAEPQATEPAYVFPDYRSPRQVELACDALLAGAQRQAERLQALPAGVASTLLPELDALQRAQEDVLGPLSVLMAVHPAKPIRDAAEACELRYQRFSNAFLQNARVHALLGQLVPADDIDRRFQREQLDAFEDAGVALGPAARASAQAINLRITRLSQAFEREIREDKTRVPLTRSELAGVPAAAWNTAPRDARGRYLLGLDAPTVEAVVDNAVQGRTRERLWRAYLSQGGPANIRRLDRLARERRAYAGLMGFDSYADFVLRRRMVRDESTAQAFLATVKTAVGERELADLALLRAEKASHLGHAGAVLQRWDVGFYAERVRRARHQVNQDDFRAYFPPEASLDFVFSLAGQLFGLRFDRLPQALWHADARAYAVSEIAGGRTVGTLFVDLYPRADKYNHAAVWSFRNVSTQVGRLPAAALVVNFNRQGLSLGELETLLHEFGHALHSLLSSTRYASQGGTSTQLDFVEAPSQMLEDWVYDPKVLALFQQVCASCRPVPPELLGRAVRARDFAKGVLMARQHLFARYDLALYGRRAVAPLSLWRSMEAATPLGHVQGTMFPAGFSHIAGGGYAAGYYGYLWSLVLAEDLRTAFEADKLDAGTGQRLRDHILSQGGQVDPRDMMRHFLGRDSNGDAFFKALQRQ